MVPTPMKLGLAALAAGLLSACSDPNGAQSSSGTVSSVPSASDTYQTLVSASGDIALPDTFAESWAHLGSWAVVNENGSGNGLHNVYTTPDVITHYQDTGAFPDGAVLVKEVLNSTSGQLTTGTVHWATDNNVWFVMVKDTESRFPENGIWGDGWGWALFNGDDRTTQVASEYKAECRSCHVPAKNDDWVYVRAYPALSQ